MPLAHNPLGRIPTLERPNGPAIHDSRVICRYLDDLFAAGFYPAPPALWSVLTLEATADGVLDTAVAMVYERRVRDPARVSNALLDAWWARIMRTLAAVELRWMSHLAGRFYIAQIAIGVMLSYLDLRHGQRDWRAPVHALAKWHADFAMRPLMQLTDPALDRTGGD
jgi:glutathione S-transferase